MFVRNVLDQKFFLRVVPITPRNSSSRLCCCSGECQIIIHSILTRLICAGDLDQMHHTTRKKVKIAAELVSDSELEAERSIKRRLDKARRMVLV